jgi:hypothetical protein
VVTCKLVAGKVTFIHREVWPALVRLAERIGPARLARVEQEHTPSGAHRNIVTPFPDWVPAAVRTAGRRMSEAKALAAPGLAACLARPRADGKVST